MIDASLKCMPDGLRPAAQSVKTIQTKGAPMKIATFNVNGVRARLNTLTTWLKNSAPDVAVLQEIKSVDEGFPRQEIEDLGYNVETHGQKGFNGVAILSKFPLEDVIFGLPGDDTDEQARWIEATVLGNKPVRVCGLYLPNGNPAPGPKYDYKLAWMDRLYTHARDLMSREEPALMCGDYNIIPQPEDAAQPSSWMNDALFRPESRAAFRRILNLGFTEAFRACNDGSEHYSFWDYQAGAWNRNDGIRIDHFLLTPQCADLLDNCWIESSIRGCDRPSDHVPVWIDLNI